MVKIIADSTCDLSDEIIKKFNIDLLPLYIHMGDKEYKDRLEITPEDTYLSGQMKTAQLLKHLRHP